GVPAAARGEGPARGAAPGRLAGAGAAGQPAHAGADRRPGGPGVPPELAAGAAAGGAAAGPAGAGAGGPRRRRVRPGARRGPPAELVEQLRQRVLDPKTPAMFRLELVRLMTQHRELDDADLRKLLDQTMPAPVRLIVAEALLSDGPCPQALVALHDLARLPN